MNGIEWLDDTIPFDMWLDAWCAAYRLGHRMPSVVIDYNGGDPYRWQVYLVDDESDELTAYRDALLHGIVPLERTRRRLTDAQAYAFFDRVLELLPTEAGDGTPAYDRRYALLIAGGLSIAQELWDDYVAARPKPKRRFKP